MMQPSLLLVAIIACTALTSGYCVASALMPLRAPAGALHTRVAQASVDLQGVEGGGMCGPAHKMDALVHAEMSGALHVLRGGGGFVHAPLVLGPMEEQLYEAVSRGDAAEVKLLLAAGANTEPKDGMGNTPLHNAARKGYEDVVRALLAGGADKMARNNGNRTPWRLADRHGREQVAKLLRDAPGGPLRPAA